MGSIVYAKEFWTGDSRDGSQVDSEGYHFYKMTKDGNILEAYEYYETDSGIEVATPMPEMKNVSWINDLGFEDMSTLDILTQAQFSYIVDISKT